MTIMFHAFEIATESCYLLWVDTNEVNFNAKLDDTMKEFRTSADTTLVGTVDAANIADALDLIRNGLWEYTQFC